jgi:hypothetical protein
MDILNIQFATIPINNIAFWGLTREQIITKQMFSMLARKAETSLIRVNTSGTRCRQ